MDRTLKDLINERCECYADRPAVRTLQAVVGQRRVNAEYKPISYGELDAQRQHLAAGLASLGLRKGDRLGILTDGGLEPLLTFLATDLLGICTVPFCNKSAAEILIHSLNHSMVDALVLDLKGYEQIQEIVHFLSRPPRLIICGEAGKEISWDELLACQDDVPQVEIRPEDETKILYTSGSSGLPKGVVQTHANIVANVEQVWDLIRKEETCRFFKSAPDYHSMGILNIYYPLAKGWVLDLARSPDRVLSDIRLAEPEGFLTVPLVLDKVYGGVRKTVAAGGFKGKLVERAITAKKNIARGEAGIADHLLQATLGKRVIEKIWEQLASRVGPNLELLVVGSAKADPEALDFFQDVLGITTFEGYGVTECAPMIAANHLGGRKVGTVGRPLIEARIVGPQGEELAYADPQNNVMRPSGEKSGELWVSGPNVMKGYLNDPDQTAQVLVEDSQGKIWYRTGDLFSMDEEGFLTFRGRLGRQFKLRNGEFINPEILERLFGRVSLIEHVLVVGDQNLSQPVVLCAVDLEEIKKITAIADLPIDDEAAMRTHPEIEKRVREMLLAEAHAAGLPAYQRPQNVIMLPEALNEENGTLTRGLKKIVPKVVVERYKELLKNVLDTN